MAIHTDIHKLEGGFLKEKDILAPGVIPVSRSTWYRGVDAGVFPKPLKLGRVNIWSVESINEVIRRIKSGEVTLDC